MWNPTLGRYLVAILCLGSPVSWSWTNFTTHNRGRERDVCIIHACIAFIYAKKDQKGMSVMMRMMRNVYDIFFQIADIKRPVFGARSAWQVLTSWCRWVMRWPRMSPSPPIPMWVASARPLSTVTAKTTSLHSLSAKAGFWSKRTKQSKPKWSWGLWYVHVCTYWLISIVNLRSPSFDLVSWLIEDKEELEVRLLFGSKFVKVLVPSPKLLAFHDFTWSIVWRPVLQKSIASAMVQCAKPCRNLCCFWAGREGVHPAGHEPRLRLLRLRLLLLHCSAQLRVEEVTWL